MQADWRAADSAPDAQRVQGEAHDRARQILRVTAAQRLDTVKLAAWGSAAGLAARRKTSSAQQGQREEPVVADQRAAAPARGTRTPEPVAVQAAEAYAISGSGSTDPKAAPQPTLLMAPPIAKIAKVSIGPETRGSSFTQSLSRPAEASPPPVAIRAASPFAASTDRRKEWVSPGQVGRFAAHAEQALAVNTGIGTALRPADSLARDMIPSPQAVAPRAALNAQSSPGAFVRQSAIQNGAAGGIANAPMPDDNGALSTARGGSDEGGGTHAGGPGPTTGDVFLDGTLMGRWVARSLAQMAARPGNGAAGFDPSRSPFPTGAMIGG